MKHFASLARSRNRQDAHCPSTELFVERVNPPPAESHHRLLCRIASCWPEGFQPFADAAFQPVASEPLPQPV